MNRTAPTVPPSLSAAPASGHQELASAGSTFPDAQRRMVLGGLAHDASVPLPDKKTVERALRGGGAGAVCGDFFPGGKNRTST